MYGSKSEIWFSSSHLDKNSLVKLPVSFMTPSKILARLNQLHGSPLTVEGAVYNLSYAVHLGVETSPYLHSFSFSYPQGELCRTPEMLTVSL